MKPSAEQIRRLAEKVYADLDSSALIIPKAERAQIVAAVGAAITRDFEQEQALERDAERLLDETIRAMGRGAAEIDRRRMLKMIKDKLARERKVVL